MNVNRYLRLFVVLTITLMLFPQPVRAQEMGPEQIVSALENDGWQIAKSVTSDKHLLYPNMCQVVATFILFANDEIYTLSSVSDLVGLNISRFAKLTNGAILQDSEKATLTMYFPKEFCDEGSGKSGSGGSQTVSVNESVPVVRSLPKADPNQTVMIIFVLAIVVICIRIRQYAMQQVK